MDAHAPMLRAATAWCDLVHQAHRLDPSARLEALATHLAHLYACGLRLPVAAGPPPEPPAVEPWPDSWPGLGEAEGAAPSTTVLIEGLTSDLSRGLTLADKDPGLALAWWRHTFDARWGTLATVAMVRLHPTLVQERSPATPADEVQVVDPAAPVERTETVVDEGMPPEPPTVAPAKAPSMLSFEPAPPTRVGLGRGRQPSTAADRGVLGLRFDRGRGGLTVTAVHPQGPAAGRLEVGDQVVAVDGLPLANRDETQIQAALSGPAGQARTFSVARGAGLVPVEIIPMAADQLAAPPLSIAVLILDSDAAQVLRDRASSIGAQTRQDEEQEAVLHLTGPADATPAATQLVSVGEAAGWWERLT